MRLNEKALKKIQNEMEYGEYQIPCGYENVEGMSIYHLKEHEFEYDDFENCIVLTIEEAKRLHECAMFFWSDYEGTRYFTDDDRHFLTTMKERITQKEVKHLKKEIAQLEQDQARDNYYHQLFIKNAQETLQHRISQLKKGHE